MKGARILILLVALAAGGGAFYLINEQEPPPPPAPTPVAQMKTVDVLVASGELGIGQTVIPGSIRWQAWPAEAASQNYIRRNERPDAIVQLSGSITRGTFAEGEPIREAKLIKADGSGYLAAVLPAGMRAISTPISPETGAGGFILPNDRVDVILIRAQKTANGEVYTSETILGNVRVLAIDQTVEEKNGQRVVVGKIATLALAAKDAETLALATRLGSIALVLRSLADAKQADNVDAARANLTSREGIGIVRFGQQAPTLR